MQNDDDEQGCRLVPFGRLAFGNVVAVACCVVVSLVVLRAVSILSHLRIYNALLLGSTLYSYS